MIKVVPFNQTTGGEKFKKFLATPFTIDVLYPIFGDKSVETLFEGWRGKDMVNWHKFTNDDKVILEIYPETYKITYKTNSFVMPFPKTIGEFIDDMYRFNIQLYWTDWIDLNFEPKEYLHVDEIKDYFVKLLGKMDKSNELI